MASHFSFNLDELQDQFRQNANVSSGSGLNDPKRKQTDFAPDKRDATDLQNFIRAEHFFSTGSSNDSKTRATNFRLAQPASPKNRRQQSEELRDQPFIGNSTSTRHHQLTFLDRFRSRASSSPKHSSGRAVLTSSSGNSYAPYSSSPGSNNSDIFFSSCKSKDGSSASLSSNRTHSKPRKWYSFTSLLSRSNLKEILTLPRSRLSVSSIFTTTTSDGELTPTTESLPGYTAGFGRVKSNGRGRGLPGCFDDAHNQPSSPTPSCVTISGEFPSSVPGAPWNSTAGTNNVVYRKPRYGQRSVSASAASGVTFNPSGLEDSRSGNYKGTSSLKYNNKGGNRLSCGEFFPGPAPSSPGFLGPDFQFHFYSSSRNNGNAGRVAEQGIGNPKRAFGRSLPTLLEAMESSSNLNGNAGASDEPSSVTVTVDTVSELLYQEYAILTGSKTLEDHYIIIFPDRGNFHQLAEEDYRRLMRYLTSVPPMQDAEPGFVIIVDRRNDKWNSVKSLLIRISCYFPGLIHRVFVLRPVGFLQKALSEVSSKLFRTENLRFRLTVCNHVSDLLSFADPAQLTVELGGLLVYDKVQWVEQRVEVEAFHLALQTLSRDLKGFTESFVELEYPNDVASTEKLIQSKTDEYGVLKSDLTQAGDHGEGILRRIKNVGSNGTNGKPEKQVVNSVQLVNVLLVERFILQIDETGRLFQEFWDKEKCALERCLHLRRFEQEFRELRAAFDANVKSLNAIPEMGDTLAATETLILDTVNFQESTKPDLTRALGLEVIGREIVSTDPTSVDTVEPKCIELSRMASHFRFIVQEKVTKQKQWREVQGTIEKANVLCTEGMDLLSSQKMMESTEENLDWNNMKTEMDLLLSKIEGQVEELVSLKGSLALASTSQPKTLVKQVLRRVEEVQGLCSKRQLFINQQLERKPAGFFKTRRSSGNMCNTGADSKSIKSNSGFESSTDGSSIGSARTSFSSTNSSEGGFLNGKCNDEDKSKEIKRYHVLQELLQTEQTYVDEIGLVLTGYRDQALNPEMKYILPSQLKHDYDPNKVGTNVSVLFCNLDEIHSFHSKIFLPDLSACIKSIELVALCFIQRHSDFLAMYSQYCQLKAASDTLVKEIGENHHWFFACQEKLGHRLPLSSYLLKPVQRITKYHLLLGSLLKHSDMCDGVSELMEALDCMVVVVRSVNDGMHQLHIRGYPAKLSMEGPLLLQGPFTVWIETAKNRLRLKGHQRYLFLYQKSILVCKKTGQQSSLTYEFKNKINLSEVGITEDPKGSGASKKFEIWIQGRQKVFVLQASAREIKVQWVQEIKRLLMEQLQYLRESKCKTATTASSSTAGNFPLSVLNTGMKRTKLKACKGATLNGWITSPSTGHRALHKESSCETSDSGRPKSRSVDTDFEEDHWTTEAELSNSEDEESVSQVFSLPGASAATSSNANKLFKSGSSSSMSMYGNGENIENGPKFVVSNNYVPIDSSCEIPLRKGEIVVLVKTGCAGWWFVRTTGNEPIEGWAPSGFLEKQSNPSQSSISSSQSVTTIANSTSQPLHKQSSVPCLTEVHPSTYGSPGTERLSSDFQYEASVISKMCSELSAGSSRNGRRSTDPAVHKD